MPLSIDIKVSPENTRWRNRVSCSGLVNSLMPMWRQESWISSSTSALLRPFARILDDDLHRPAVGQQPHAVGVAVSRFSPIWSSR